MTWELRVSRLAENDIEHVLAWTWAHFGEQQYIEYRELIRAALIEIAQEPHNIRAKRRPEIHPEACTMHVARPGKPARHFVLYRCSHNDVVEIDRLLHDSMDIERHLPEDYR